MIKGQLEPFFETGTEGIIWSIEEPGKGYEGLHCLKNGDFLKVYKKDTEEVLWEGMIDLEYKRCYQPYPLNPQYGQQAIFGYWIRGLQKSLDPEVWAKMFFDNLKAEFIRKEDL